MSKCCCNKPKNNCCCAPSPCCCQPTCNPVVMEPMCVPVQPFSFGVMPMENNQNNSCGSGCSFSCLIILILILLQFSNCGGFLGGNDGCEGGNFLVDKGIIFIIALYYLSCVCPCA